MTSAFPERIGNYRVVRPLGEGGMGIVYEAVEELSGRRVALKVLHANLSASPDARARFFNEMRIMASFEHPNVARSLASLEVDGKLVLVLELYEGRTLREELEAMGPLPLNRALAIALAIASALSGAHERAEPIVHRDLKPENVMLLRDGSVRVMDFGIAKVLGGGGNLTQASQAVGTVLYMSPEQAEARGITPQTDLYALGLVIYEMLAGKPVFDAPSIMAVLRAHCETPAPRLPDAARSVAPPDLERLIAALLEKAPEHRPPGARFVLGELHRIAVGGMGSSAAVPAMPLAARSPARVDTYELVARFNKKRATPWRVTAIVGVVIAAAALWMAWSIFYPAPTKSSKKASDSAEVETTAATPRRSAPPAAPAAPTCRQEALACSPMTQADPRDIDFELLLVDATKLARTIEPGAVCRGSRSYAFTQGKVDVTVPRGGTFFEFGSDGASFGMEVRVDRTQLELTRTSSRPRDPVGATGCSLARATAAVTALGVPVNDIQYGSLTRSSPFKRSAYHFVIPGTFAWVDAANCAVLAKPDVKK